MKKLKEYVYLSTDEIKLKLEKIDYGDIEKYYVPAYKFKICLKDGTEVGECDLRIGHNKLLYYGGNIGYRVYEEYRGHHYASKAVELLIELAIYHELGYLIITCNPDNLASRRTCELSGARLMEIVELPLDNDMRQNGETHKCIYYINLNP